MRAPHRPPCAARILLALTAGVILGIATSTYGHWLVYFVLFLLRPDPGH